LSIALSDTIKYERIIELITFCSLCLSILRLAGNEIHLYVVPATNLLILFCVRIEVRRAKRSQSDAVRTMLGRCVARKAAVQSFHPCNNTPPNSHNRSTRKINDMSMSVRDGKILLVVRQPRCIV